MTPTAAERLARAQSLGGELTAIRHHLHAHPELSFEESATRDWLRARLEELGFECRAVAGTGLLARLPSTRPAGAPVVALRAELDALPIDEPDTAPFHSTRPGVMHACGHDAHMTMVYGAGRLLQSEADTLAGRVVLLFQPAEEVPPGGAVRVLGEGVLAEEGVGAIFGMHVDPRYPTGRLLLRRGPLMAASDRFRITVIGKGGHGGYPHLTVDPVVTAAQIVLALQTLVARRLDPTEPGVVSVGRIAGGSADNVIPDRVEMSGTLRSQSDTVRRQLPEWIRQTAEGVAAAAGARAEFEYLPGHPGLSNDPAMIDFVSRVAEPLFGSEAIVELEKPIMGGEDFAHYLGVLPGAFLRIGTRNEAAGAVHPLHSPRFTLDEAVLPIGAALLATVARAWLDEAAAR